MNQVAPLNAEWSKRLQILNDRYDNMSEENVVFLGKKFNIRYFVTASKKHYSFPIVYKNRKYIVYEIVNEADQ